MSAEWTVMTSAVFKLSQLVDMVEHHLLNALVETERPESVVENVVTEYLHDLKMSGAIPIASLGEVTEELRDLALEIIRKRTYGCHTLAEYRRRPIKARGRSDTN